MSLNKTVKSQGVSEEEHDFIICTPVSEQLWSNTS